MKYRIQTVCLLKEEFDDLPEVARLIIEADGQNFKDDGNLISFELTVATLDEGVVGAGPRYSNRYFCPLDHVEWRLTGCLGPEQDNCPDCQRPTMPLMTEQDGCLSEHTDFSRGFLFGQPCGEINN